MNKGVINKGEYYINLNPLNLDVNFFSSFDGELGSWFWRAILQITGSTQSTILNWNVLRPNKPDEEQKTNPFLSEDQKDRAAYLHFCFVFTDNKMRVYASCFEFLKRNGKTPKNRNGNFDRARITFGNL